MPCLGSGLIESLVIIDIEGDGLGVLEAFRKLLGVFKSSASYIS
jgi:hypothetical protein